MKIALDVRPALSKPTGVGVYIGALAEALPKGRPDAHFTLFTSSLRERWGRPKGAPNVDVVDRRIPVRALNFAWNRLGAPAIETLCGRDFDVVHSPHALLTPASRARRIITIHDLFFFKRPEMTGKEVRRDYAPLVRDHAARADGILCPSEYTAGEIERLLGISRKKVRVTFYGVDASLRRPLDPAVVDERMTRLGLPRGAILYLGSSEERKNLPRLLAAHRGLAAEAGGAPPLILVGPGPEFLRGREAGAPVHAAGYLAREDIHALMSVSSCLVLPSLDEGFGFPVAEAMTVGLPVVCSRGSSLEEIAGGAAELIDDVLDERTIAEALQRVLGSPARAAQLKRSGLERSLLFDWDRTATSTFDFYREVVSA